MLLGVVVFVVDLVAVVLVFVFTGVVLVVLLVDFVLLFDAVSFFFDEEDFVSLLLVVVFDLEFLSFLVEARSVRWFFFGVGVGLVFAVVF